MATTTPKLAGEHAAPAWYPTHGVDGSELTFAEDADGSLRRACDAAAALVAEMQAGRPARWLTLTGNRGSGKTSLAAEIFRQARRINPGSASMWIGDRRRPRCVWFDETEFAAAIETDTRLPEYLADDYLVVIDDVGSARERWDRVADALFRLANARLGKWMVWTSNLTVKGIEDKVDGRLASRLQRDVAPGVRNMGVRITAPDYALRNRKLAA